MKKTIKVKIQPCHRQVQMLIQTLQDYIKTTNQIVDQMVEANEKLTLSSKDINTNLPSAVKNQCIRDAKSLFDKYKKTKIKSIIRKPVCIWNNQNYRVKENLIEFPVIIGGNSKRLSIPMILTDYQRELLDNKLGTLRINKKSNKWIAQITVEVEEPNPEGDKVMGIDLGIKVPAVAYSEGKVKFFGNGRENKYKRRYFKQLRKKLGKAKQPKVIKKIANKEQRWMNDIDHKISREIVNFAIDNHVSVIQLESLENIRNTTRTSRKNEFNLHNWSFYRLSQYVEYKAKCVGIKVIYVDPKYTSQICPSCSERNKAKDRLYKCKCGYRKHRDLVGAINISRVDGVA